MRILLILLLLATPTLADNVNLSWDLEPTAYSYMLYRGLTPGIYTENQPAPTSPYIGLPLTVNVRNYVNIASCAADGTPGPLNTEIHGFPRPVILDATSVDLGGLFRIIIDGRNFSDGVAMVDNQYPGMVILAVNRISAIRIEVDYTVVGGADPAELVISNQWEDGAGFVASLPSTMYLMSEGVLPPPPVWQSVY